jgi:hypothetical protein
MFSVARVAGFVWSHEEGTVPVVGMLDVFTICGKATPLLVTLRATRAPAHERSSLVDHPELQPEAERS